MNGVIHIFRYSCIIVSTLSGCNGEKGAGNKFPQTQLKNRPYHAISSSTGEEDKEIKTDDWARYIKGTLGLLGERLIEPSIHRVRNKLQVNPEAGYNPRIVSIGPYHVGEQHQHLLAMEERKWHYMLHHQHQHRHPDDVSDEDIRNLAIRRAEAWPEAVLDTVPQARGSYSEDIQFCKHELAEIMLVDACFILELLLRHIEHQKGIEEKSDPYDPIFKTDWMIARIRHDLVLPENQIPFFVLQKLFDEIRPCIPKPGGIEIKSLRDLVLSFFFIHPDERHNGVEPRHLLDLLHKIYPPPPFPPTVKQSPPMKQRNQQVWGFKYPAIRLAERGIRIHKQGRASESSDEEKQLLWTGGLLHVTFDNGALKIPTLCLDGMTASILRNLIAFEQISLDGEHPVTCYALLIRSLIQTRRDVEYLRGRGILKGERRVAKRTPDELFRWLCEDVVQNRSYFSTLCHEVSTYDTEWCHLRRWAACALVWCEAQLVVLKASYFANPWKSIAVIFGIIIAVLGLIQTTVSLLQYLRSDK